MRQINVYDTRNLSGAISMVEVDHSNGTLIPLFDADTNALYLAGKGDSQVRFFECSNKDPWVIPGECLSTAVQSHQLIDESVNEYSSLVNFIRQ